MILNAGFSGPQAWLLLAIRRGYLAAAGIQLGLTQGNGAFNAAPTLVRERYDIAYGDIYSLVEVNAGRRLDAPVCVFAMFNASPAAIAVLQTSAIRAPSDLAGKGLIGHQSDVGLRTFGAFALSAGLDPAAIRISHAEGAMSGLAARLEAGDPPDGLFGYVSTITSALAAEGRDAAKLLRWLRYADHAPDLYGSGLMVSRKLAEAEPGLVKALLAAISMGLRDAIADPEAAMDAVLEFNPAANRAAERLRWLATLANEMGHHDGMRLGYGNVDPGRFARGVALHAASLGLARIPGVEEIFTPAFLPPLADRAFPALSRLH